MSIMAENVEKTAADTREKVNEKVDEVKEKMKKLKDKKIAEETYGNREKNWESPRYAR